MASVPLRDLFDIPLRDCAALPLRPVRVAVLDTGIDASHSSLHGRVVRATAWRKANSGAILSSPLRRGADNDPSGHGTGVAAIIAGIAPNARIEDVRVLAADSAGYGSVVLRALEDAIDGDADVINLSVAIAKDRWWPETSRLLERAYVRNKVVVAARRNVPRPDDLGLPAELPTAISVDAGAFASPWLLRFLPRSPVEFAAAGCDVRTARAGGGTVRLTGTSFAAPAVSALCALLRGANPRLTIFEIKSVLKWHAERSRCRRLPPPSSLRS